MHFDTLFLSVHTSRIATYSWRIDLVIIIQCPFKKKQNNFDHFLALKSAVSDFSTVLQLSFDVLALCNFLPPFTFNLAESLYVKHVPCRQFIVGPVFNHSIMSFNWSNCIETIGV